MKTYKKKITQTKPLLEIVYDESPTSPRDFGDFENLGYFITVERAHRSPDFNEPIQAIITETSHEAKSTKDHMQLITQRINSEIGETVLAIYPVNKYEHGNVIYRIGVASGFDFSNCGFYIVTDESIKALGTNKEDFERVVKQELSTYTAYVNGEVYRYTLYDEKGDIEDEGSGFYDIEEIRGNLGEEWSEENLNDYLIQ